MASSRVGLCCSVFLLFAFANSFCFAGDSCTSTEMEKEHMHKLATLNNDLALNLHQKLSAGSSENVFFSPLSISIAFAMLFYGARGDTAEDLRSALSYNKAEMPDDLVHHTFNRYLSDVLKSDSSDEYVLNVANAILLNNHVELVPDYKSQVHDLYQAAVQDVDFMRDGAVLVNEINNWVKQKTNGKIDSILDELDPSTVVVLLNAVYFKGTWRIQFQREKTRPQLFFNGGLDSESRNVSFMHMSARFRYAAFDDCQVLELPYKGEDIAMLIILPDQRDGLAALEDSLNYEKMLTIQHQLYDTKVIISLPKFKIQYSKELSGEMKELGAGRIFQAGAADFSGMTPSQNVFISQVLHKAVVEVNEEGSEAAAVTAIVSNRMRPLFDFTPEFTADHPFLFAIVDQRNDMILFMGRVNNL